jgi:transposase
VLRAVGISISIQRDPNVRLAIDIESWIEADHPLRDVEARADAVLKSMRKGFDRGYSSFGRPSIPPEMLLKALLLQALYSIRSERQLVDQVRMNLLYHWFIDLSLDAPVWNATTFTKNRERFEEHGLLRKFLRQGRGASPDRGVGQQRAFQRGRDADPELRLSQEPSPDRERRHARKRRV